MRAHRQQSRKDRRGVQCNAGRRVPEGSAAVGWRVGVYWRDDQKFYMGEIAAYNDEDDEYEMNYDDSELLAALLVHPSPPPSPHPYPTPVLQLCCLPCIYLLILDCN